MNMATIKKNYIPLDYVNRNYICHKKDSTWNKNVNKTKPSK